MRTWIKKFLGLNNCLLFAIIRAIKNDEYVVIRKSRHNHKWVFFRYHFLVIPKDVVNKHAVSYVPKAESLGDWPLPLFDGYVKKGDK